MEPSLSPILITLGLVFAIHAILVESQNGGNTTSPPPPAPPPYQPPHPQQASPPPPEGTRTPPPSLPPPPRMMHNKPPERRKRRRPPPPPPPHKNKLNTGKKIGLLFAGVAAILQIGVVGFLVFKRRQLLVIKDRYETCST